MAYQVLGVETPAGPVLLDTHMNNQVAEELVSSGALPFLRGASVKGREVKFGTSRFDFLLAGPEGETIVEVKSCTLFYGPAAMFPDAPSARARRHLEELRTRARSGGRSMVLFLVHSSRAELFLPDYHTDYAFARELLDCRGQVEIRAAALGWEGDLRLEGPPREIPIAWGLLEREACDRGAYMLILHLPRRRRIAVGSLGQLSFPAGYYLYVGSAMGGLEARLARHRRMRKKMHWHVDYLRAQAELVASLPVRTPERIECRLAQAASRLSEPGPEGFGSSDCSCPTHLFRWPRHPLQDRRFVEMLLSFRMGRLLP